jgi:small subunit ribosomal protein S11
MYPDENTPTRLFNGIPFRDVPICNIKASKNNTIITVSNAKGGSIIIVLECECHMLRNLLSKLY